MFPHVLETTSNGIVKTEIFLLLAKPVHNRCQQAGIYNYMISRCIPKRHMKPIALNAAHQLCKLQIKHKLTIVWWDLIIKYLAITWLAKEEVVLVLKDSLPSNLLMFRDLFGLLIWRILFCPTFRETQLRYLIFICCIVVMCSIQCLAIFLFFKMQISFIWTQAPNLLQQGSPLLFKVPSFFKQNCTLVTFQ